MGRGWDQVLEQCGDRGRDMGTSRDKDTDRGNDGYKNRNRGRDKDRNKDTCQVTRYLSD